MSHTHLTGNEFYREQIIDLKNQVAYWRSCYYRAIRHDERVIEQLKHKISLRLINLSRNGKSKPPKGELGLTTLGGLV